MIATDDTLRPDDLRQGLHDLWGVARKSITLLRERWDAAQGTPVFTRAGRYTSRGWTEWTQGFQYGSALLLFEATGDEELLEYGRTETMRRMAPHVTHVGVHDHGFNNVSTYGNLLRMMSEGTIPEDAWQREYYELALKLSGAVQASRWIELPGDIGYVCSFNGPHSLFADTIRSMRSLALGHQLGHLLMGEQDQRISLLGRLLKHAEATARYNVFFGPDAEGNVRDSYDIRGRVVHESIFNLRTGAYRCPSTQQGYSPFTTWTRGLSWILAGYPEELEWIDGLSDEEIAATDCPANSVAEIRERFLEVSRAVADFYIEQIPTDGIPYWDTGAPGLARMGDYLDRPADPFNEHEPVDSSAAAIGAQGLLRLGRYLASHGEPEAGSRYTQAGLTAARTLLADPYLARGAGHEGILLHTVYHQPNGWDYVAPGQKVPNGESAMWGDYHLLELGLYLQRLADGREPQRFFDIGRTA
ncbi:MAG: glycosyl hydrolase [Spirochaetota bacterium]